MEIKPTSNLFFPKHRLRTPRSHALQARFLTALLAVILLCGCKEKAALQQTTIDGLAQGGTYHIVLIGPDSYDSLRTEIDSLLSEIDNSVSLFNPTSRLSRINAGESDSLDSFLIGCIRSADTVSRIGKGCYDITVKPLTAAYGFTGGRPTQHPNVDSLLQFVGYQKIRIEGERLVRERPEIQLDLNSIAQGASADAIGRLIEAHQIENYLVEIGGEIYCKGHNLRGKPWRVGIDRPTEGNLSPGANLQVRIGIHDCGLATSGNYRKFYTDSSGRKIVHTINARTGLPVESNLLSATIIAPTSTMADAFGTLCMVVGLEESKRLLAEQPHLQGYLVWADSTGAFRTYATPGLRQFLLPEK